LSTSNANARVSKHYRLERDQTTLDFVDVPIGNDVAVFLDPSRLRSMDSIWASECNSLLQHFFETLLGHIQRQDMVAGIYMLEGLSEKNEFHLGLSRGKSQGTGFGPQYARKFWDALTKSKAGRTGLLKDLEDACLFIEGVGPDRISDATCNIIRGPLIRYTQDMCLYYGIPTSTNVPSGPVWNPETQKWEELFIELPVTPYGTLLLVPKIVVRHRLVYNAQQYYTHYLLPEMQAHEQRVNSGLVHTLKDGRKRVTKIALRKKYGVDKLSIAEQTSQHPDVLEQYRIAAIKTSKPISHHQLAEIEKIDLPRFDQLLESVVSLPVGREHAGAFENVIEALLTALFFPSLTFPKKQHELHEGRKRIDIKYVNSAQDGFFSWIGNHYSAAHIFVECKNYGKEIGNPELDQLAGRFGPSRGQVGILVCRSVENSERLARSCADTARDMRGFILTVTDSELKQLVKEYTSSLGGSEYPLLRAKFNALTM
jgi:hypothetical protein